MAPGRMADGSCNLLSALEACDECDDSRSRLSGDQSSEGESVTVGQECSRLRPFKFGCVPVPMPVNGCWYQNKEAVRVLRQAREEGAMLKHVVDAMRARNFLDITYQTMMQKVKMVDSEGRFSAEDRHH